MTSSKMVKSISRAASILRSISGGTNRITQIAGETGLSNGTVHRLIKTLQAEGFVEQDPLTLGYGLGPFLIWLALEPLIVHANLVSCSIEEMEHLRRITGESVGLAIRSGVNRLQLEELPSKEELKYSVGKGFVSPIHFFTASNKVLLSELSCDDRETLFNLFEAEDSSDHKCVNKAALLREISKVKKNGYAVSTNELIMGACSIAVPIKGYIIPVALSVFGPQQRFDDKEIKKALPHLKKSSHNIAKKLNKIFTLTSQIA